MRGRHMRANELTSRDANAVRTRSAQYLPSVVVNNGNNEFNITTTRGKIERGVWNEGANVIDH
jgi:hypothetical protein